MTHLVASGPGPGTGGIPAAEKKPLEQVDSITQVSLEVRIDVNTGQLAAERSLTAAKEPGENMDRIAKIYQ